MSCILKNITVQIILAAFLMVVLFSFVTMSSGPDGRMQGDCPFSATGVSLCPQNSFASILHHLAAYESFINVPIGFGLAALVAAIYLVGLASLLFASWLLIPIATAPLLLYESPPLVVYHKKLIRWLSLFEHSPSN